MERSRSSILSIRDSRLHALECLVMDQRLRIEPWAHGNRPGRRRHETPSAGPDSVLCRRGLTWHQQHTLGVSLAVYD